MGQIQYLTTKLECRDILLTELDWGEIAVQKIEVDHSVFVLNIHVKQTLLSDMPTNSAEKFQV